MVKQLVVKETVNMGFTSVVSSNKLVELIFNIFIVY